MLKSKMEDDKMLNRKYLNRLHLKLQKDIDNSDWNEKEKKYEKGKLNKLFRGMIRKEQLDNHYVSLAHEIKSYEFLKNLGNVQKAIDSKSEEGPDFTIGDYKIECVACSPGETLGILEKYRLTDYRKSGLFDYNKKLEILLPRMTSSLNEKVEKLNKYINKRNCSK